MVGDSGYTRSSWRVHAPHQDLGMDTTESRTFAARLADLLRNEQHAMADFLVALAQRRGWIALGYANLFDFLVRELGLSRRAAHRHGVPPPPHGLSAVLEEAGGRAPGALSLHARRRGRGHPLCRPRPAARPRREEQGARREAPHHASDRSGSSDPDHVPAAVRREVWERDGGCCQWAVDSGGVRGSRLRVQLDHIIPKASGGRSVTWNLRVLCERHNKWPRAGSSATEC
jgi:5-methylcytosine-specific restriction endonuclease McrA